MLAVPSRPSLPDNAIDNFFAGIPHIAPLGHPASV
jgi:hypothetical protein